MLYTKPSYLFLQCPYSSLMAKARHPFERLRIERVISSKVSIEKTLFLNMLPSNRAGKARKSCLFYLLFSLRNRWTQHLLRQKTLVCLWWDLKPCLLFVASLSFLFSAPLLSMINVCVCIRIHVHEKCNIWEVAEKLILILPCLWLWHYLWNFPSF